jgi:polyisoprenyl-phosphate glycosyltransferase
MQQIFSIIVPVYQNVKNLHDTVPKLLTLKDKLLDFKLEIVFVDDGSTDGSSGVLKHFNTLHPDIIKIVTLTRNFGQTPAIQAGLEHVSGHCVGIISADLQEPHELFIDMLSEWKKGAKFVIGKRQSRGEGWWHRNISGVYWNLVRRFAFRDFPNMGYDFCLLDRDVVDNINNINEKNSSIFVLIYWFGYSPVCLPIDRKLREKGRSQWNFFRKIQFTIDTLIGFTYVPSRLITIMSMSASFLAVLYLVFLLYIWQSTGAAPLGWMTVTGLLLLMGSLILFALGIISEYLLRILDESRKRPPYVVEKIDNIKVDEK